jgi:hypothetical protein
VQTISRRRRILGGSVAGISLLLGISLVPLSDNPPAPLPPLRIERAGAASASSAAPALGTNLVADDLRQKYSPTHRVEFHVTCDQNTSIFLLATGVQVHTPSGWQVAAEEYRGEIWRLRPGIVREVCVERPDGGNWRAYLRYGTEMKGSPVLRAQIADAWLNRSFSNWKGKAWGGGRWSGSYELLSPPITDE